MSAREASFIRKASLLARKDVKVEARGRDTLPPMLAFVLTVSLLLAFTLPAGARVATPLTTPFGTVPLADVVSGFLWIVILFAGLIAFARTFEVEREDGALDALLLVPVDRSALFLSKAVANLAFIAGVELLIVPLFWLMFGLDLGPRWLPLLLIVALADVGFVAVGTLFAALAAQTRSRELMLPILALPALVPIFIAATELTADVLLGGGVDDLAARGWFAILVTFDVIFAAVGAIAFDFVLE